MKTDIRFMLILLLIVMGGCSKEENNNKKSDSPSFPEAVITQNFEGTPRGGMEIELTAENSTTSAGDTIGLNYQWAIIGQPSNSLIEVEPLFGNESTQFQFIVDIGGTYTIELTATEESSLQVATTQLALFVEKSNKEYILGGLGNSFTEEQFALDSGTLTVTVREKGITLQMALAQSKFICRSFGSIIANNSQREIQFGTFSASEIDTTFDSLVASDNAILYDSDSTCTTFAPGLTITMDVFMELRMGLSTQQSFRYFNTSVSPTVDVNLSRE